MSTALRSTQRHGVKLAGDSTKKSTQKTPGNMYYKITLQWADGMETWFYVEGQKQSKDEVDLYNGDDSILSCYREPVTEEEYNKNRKA